MSTAMRYPTASVASTDCQCLEEISGRASDASQFQGWEQSLEGGLPAPLATQNWANLPAILLVSATTSPRFAGSSKSPGRRTTGISSTEASSCPRHGTLPVSDELGARQHYFCAAPPATAVVPKDVRAYSRATASLHAQFAGDRVDVPGGAGQQVLHAPRPGLKGSP